MGDIAADYLADAIREFRRHRRLAERALAQIADEGEFFRTLPGGSNSIAVIVKHVGGNLRSRWTDFLTTDGEKPWRNRDGEFVIGPEDTWRSLRERWDAGWDTLFATLEGLGPADLARTVTIRAEPHTVLEAMQRALTHASYHVGQIVMLARLSAGEGWTWLSVPPGMSQQYLREMLEKHRS